MKGAVVFALLITEALTVGGAAWYAHQENTAHVVYYIGLMLYVSMNRHSLNRVAP